MIPESNEILTGKYSFKLVRNSNKINRLENNMRLHRVSNNRFVGFLIRQGTSDSHRHIIQNKNSRGPAMTRKYNLKIPTLS